MKPRSAITISLALGLAAGAGQWLLRAESVKSGVIEAEAGVVAAVAPAAGVVAELPSHRPAGHAPRVATGLLDHQGREAGVACMTCHATREPDHEHGLGGLVPDEFHQGLKYAHAGMSCVSCHNADDYDALRLADGRRLAFAEAQQLCAQCHGPQTRDYRAGSHGGMTGYWDKTKGPRIRNTCTDCHDPHAPAYPAWAPVFPPRDAAARQQAEREARAASRAGSASDSKNDHE